MEGENYYTEHQQPPDTTEDDVSLNFERADDVSYLNTYFNRMEQLVRSSTRNPTLFAEAMTQNLLRAREEFCKSKFSEIFFGSGLSKFVGALVDRSSYPTLDWVNSVMVFFHDVMGVLIGLIKEGSCNSDMFRVLERILQPRNHFYQYLEFDPPKEYREQFLKKDPAEGEEQQEEAPASPKFVEITEIDTSSPFFLMNVNEFGGLGGFDAFLERIASEAPKLPCKDMNMFLRLVVQVKEVLSKPFLRSYATKLFSVAKEHFFCFTESEYRKQSLDDITASLESISQMSREASLHPLMEEIQCSKLEISHLYLGLPFLEANLKAIESMTRVIFAHDSPPRPSINNETHSFDDRIEDFLDGMVVKDIYKDDYNYNLSMANEPISRSGLRLEESEKDACQKDLETKSSVSTEYLLDFLDKRGIIDAILKLEHEQAVKQGSRIILFVAKHRPIENDLLHRIWNNNPHESLQVVVFRLILDLLEYVNSEQIDLIFDQISSLPITTYNPQVLKFISDFSKQARRVRFERGDEERDYGLSIFWGLLSEGRAPIAVKNEAIEHLKRLLSENKHQQQEFIHKCLEQVRADRCVETSLAILKKIFKSNENEMGSAIVEWDKKEGMVDCVVDELVRIDEKSLSEEALRVRLLFLDFVLTRSELILCVNQAVRLWDKLVSTKHQDQAFQWFISLQHHFMEIDPYEPKRTCFPIFSHEVTETLFSKMTQLDPKKLSLCGFRMFSHFFLNVNSKLFKLRRVDRSRFRMFTYDLHGFDTMWEIALTSESPEVAQVALSRLFTIYHNVAKKFSPTVHEERAAFISRCLSFICDGKKPLTSSNEKERAQAKESLLRALTLLSSIIMKDNKSRSSSKIHELRVKETIWRVERKRQARQLAEGSGSWEDSIARAHQLESSGEEFSIEKLEPLDQGPSSGDYIGSFWPGAHVRDLFLEKFFGFLTAKGVRNDFWDLIMILPTDETLLSQVRSLEMGETGKFRFVEWLERAPPAESVFRLLYLMQIIRILMEDDDWVLCFLASGGMQFLVGVFSDRELLIAENGEFGKQTTAHLVEAMNFLFSLGYLDLGDISGCLSTNFVMRLMGQISELAVKSQEIIPEPEQNQLKIDESDVNCGPRQRGTRIANCLYCEESAVLSFNITGKDYQVACYFVDFNTYKRHQTMVAWVGDSNLGLGEWQGDENLHPKAVYLSGTEFHEGQWVVWDVHEEGTFNITIKSLCPPNWVISALLIDKSPNPGGSHPEPSFPKAITIDNETKGTWVNKYGAYGGILLGETDYIVPPRAGTPSDAPHFGGYSVSPTFLRYEWIPRCVMDRRGLQQAPKEDAEFDPFIDEVDLEVIKPAPEATRLKMPENSIEGGKSIETSKALLKMLVDSCVNHEELLRAVMDYPDLDSWLYTCLVCCKDPKLREGVVTGLEDLCKGNTQRTDFFLKRLLAFLSLVESHPQEEGETSFTEFFQILQELLEQGEEYPSKQFFAKVFEMVGAHKTCEEEDKDLDSRLIGYLDLLSYFIDHDGENILQENEDALVRLIFHDCLFGVQESRTSPKIPKCRSFSSRSAASGVLRSAAKSESVRHLVIQMLNIELQQSELPKDWNINLFEKRSEEKSRRVNYVGLVNQGCTCYLNSLIQQLFIIPSLRNDILGVELEKEKDSVMYQLQSLFGYMKESGSKYVDTIDFCKTVKLMGAPIVMSRQEDANEFFNSLADQVEPFLMGKPQEHLFRDTFGGKLISQIISQECPHQSESPQDFLTMSLKVQSKRDIYESLDFSIQADILDGNNKWKCEQCDRHVAAKKRSCVQHLPNTLILHLTRFEFDYNTFQEVKVNDRFEFKTSLNMRPYTKEGLEEAEGLTPDPKTTRPDDYYEYELVGVLIHSGSAHSGHYYSYIRERVPADEGSEPKWYEFNDRNVTSFSSEDLPYQAFGGKDENSYHPMEKSFSAYMLFYERKNTYSAGEYSKTPIHEGSVALDVTADGGEPEVQSAILDTIWKEEVLESKKRLFMTPPTFNLMWGFVHALPPFEPVREYMAKDVETLEFSGDQLVQTIVFGTKLIFDVFSHCKDNLLIAKKFTQLTKLYGNHLPLCEWLLDKCSKVDDNSWLKNVFVFSQEDDFRRAAAEMFSLCINQLAPIERDFYLEELDEISELGFNPADFGYPAPPTKRKPRSIAIRFVNALTTLLTDSADKPPEKISPLLLVLLNFVKISVFERRILMKRNAVSELIFLAENQHRFTVHSTPGFLPMMNILLELLSVLVVGCDNPAHTPYFGAPGFPEEAFLQLPLESQTRLFDRGFLKKAIRCVKAHSFLEKIFCHWGWGQREVSETIVTSICSVMNEMSDLCDGPQYVDMLYHFVGLKDELFHDRINYAMETLFKFIKTNLSLENHRNSFIDTLIGMAHRFPPARDWLIYYDRFHLFVGQRHEVDFYLQTVHGEIMQEVIKEREEEKMDLGEERKGGVLTRGDSFEGVAQGSPTRSSEEIEWEDVDMEEKEVGKDNEKTEQG